MSGHVPAAVHVRRVLIAAAAVAAAIVLVVPQALSGSADDTSLDSQLARALARAGFTGRVESTLEGRLGRPIDKRLANIGRLLWFDTITGLKGDNTCAGCHSPTNGFGDSQPMAIGIDSNLVVGPHRTGPRNMRRTPLAINTAFLPALMWNGRFSSLSGDPFDPSSGFLFPDPEGTSLSYLPHLLDAQAFIPPTERTEVAGFDFPGDNDAIRAEVLRRLNGAPEYRHLFGQVYPSVRRGAPITFDMFGSAIAEFEFSLTFANAPIDRFARGEHSAMRSDEKRGAIIFFGKAGCSACHSVAGASNEMFSDFKEHDIGVPQLVPGNTNNTFDGSGRNEDFGREGFTGDPADRYAFRTAPLRNLAVAPAFMHDGAFTSLEAAIQHHLDVLTSVASYDPVAQGLPLDLTGTVGPMDAVLARLDPLLSKPILLSGAEFRQLVAFVREGLLDPRALPQNLRRLVPENVPSGRPTLIFEFPARHA